MPPLLLRALAAPTPKEQLLVPPSDAAHYVVVSTAGKHGDEYVWTMPDGRLAFRESILLRGLTFETGRDDAAGADGMPSDIVIRGVTPNGDAAETFPDRRRKGGVDQPGRQGQLPLTRRAAYYLPQGGPFLSSAPQIDRLMAAGRTGLTLLPSGRATFDKVASLQVGGPQGKKNVDLIFVKGTSLTPQPVWVENGKFFGVLSGLGLLPAGYEGNLDKMQAAQDSAIAALAPATAKKFLTADAKRPVLFSNVKMYDADAERFLDHRYVLTSGGKIVSVGTAAPAKLPAGTRVIAGAGKTLVPGLWDSHMHVGDDFQTVSELALGVTSCRNPGGPIELEVSQRERRDAGTLARAGMLRFGHRRPQGPAGRAGQPRRFKPRGDARRGAQDQGQQPDRGEILHVDEPGVDRARARSSRTSSGCTSTAISRPGCARSTRSTPAMTRSPTSISRRCRRCPTRSSPTRTPP